MSYTDSKFKQVQPSFKGTKLHLHKVTAKEMKTVELVHVGPPASVAVHYLLRVGHYYYSSDPGFIQLFQGYPKKDIKVMTLNQYRTYSSFHLEVARTKIHPSDPTAAASRLNTLLKDGWKYSLTKSNCLDFANYVITGNRRSNIFKQFSTEAKNTWKPILH